MKYQYIFDINAALSRAFTRSIQLSIGEGDVSVEEIASDIDSALGTWRANVNCFRSDNSDRFTEGSPMPPEVKDLLFFLRCCYDFAKARVKRDADDSEGWSDRLRGLALAIMVVSSYYPDDEGGQKSASAATSTATARREAHKPKAQLKDYLNGVTVDAFKESLSPEVQGNTPSGLGEIIRKEVQSGRLTKRNGYIAAFLRAFDIYDDKTLNGIRKYLIRRTGA